MGDAPGTGVILNLGQGKSRRCGLSVSLRLGAKSRNDPKYANMLLAGLVLFAVADFAYHSYLLEYAPEAVKLRCAHEPIDFVKYQYSRCIARNWHD
jgi:hypothetical protein